MNFEIVLETIIGPLAVFIVKRWGDIEKSHRGIKSSHHDIKIKHHFEECEDPNVVPVGQPTGTFSVSDTNFLEALTEKWLAAAVSHQFSSYK